MNARALAVALLVCVPAAAAAPHRASHHKQPAGVVTVSVGSEKLTLWPYLTSDFETPSDPVNLVFLDADPRAVREALMKLDGNRQGTPVAGLPGANCTWTDAMGYEQAAFVRPERWVSGAIQLACVNPGKPLGGPFRFHLRLFRSGHHTVGGAHYEINIPGTAEHEVLSWDAARGFVAVDLQRTGALTAAPVNVPALIPPGSFREVRRPVYDAISGMAGGAQLLAALGLVAPASPTAAVPIPTSGAALGFTAALSFDPGWSNLRTTTDVQYGVIAPKPFCNGPADYVKLEGPLHFSLQVRTTPWGAFLRTYRLSGTLTATPVNPLTGEPIGEPQQAEIAESHVARLTDHDDQVTERVSQVLLGDPEQSLKWVFAAGDIEYFRRSLSCGSE